MKRLASMLLTLCLLLGMAPPRVFAADTPPELVEALAEAVPDDAALLSVYGVPASEPLQKDGVDGAITIDGEFRTGDANGQPADTTGNGDTPSGTCGDNLTWTLVNGVLTISGTGAMTNYQYDNNKQTYTMPWADSRESITTVIIENGVTSIGNYAFIYCYNLKSVTTPDSVTSIGKYAFYDCDGLTNEVINTTIFDNVTSIGEGAFFSCDSLTSVTIPSNVTSIGDGAFNGGSSLTGVNVESGNTQYSSENGILFNKDKTILYCYPAGKKDEVTYTIPDSVTSIKDEAFIHCRLTNVSIHKGVTSIGDTAFGFSGLTDVTIPDSVTSIGNSIFTNCKALKSVTIPSSVTSIGETAFENCAALTDVDYGGTKAQWGEVRIGGNNEALTSATIHCTDGDIIGTQSGDSDTYTVTFDTHGGTPEYQPVSVQANGTVSEPTQPPTRDGYKFKGWFTDAQLTNAFDFKTPITENLILYAGWELLPAVEDCTVTFISEGQTLKQYVVEMNTKFSESVQTPTRDGYEFMGWFTTEDASGTAFNFDTPITGNLTLYAGWKVRVTECHVIFEANGGGNANAMSEVTVSADASYTLPQCQFTPPENMAFRAWQCVRYDADSNPTTTEGKPGDKLDLSGVVSLILTAQWQTASVNAYTVSYYLYENDTEPYQTSTVNPGELHTLGSNAPLPVGGAPQALIAWNVNGTRYNVGDQITVNANLKIVAVIRYTSSYVNIWLNGDGSELDRKEFSRASGANPSIYEQYYSTDKTPVKAEDAEHSYTFREWDSGTRAENTVSESPYRETVTITTTYKPIFDAVSKLDPYRVLEPFGNMTAPNYEDRTWHLAGPLSEFQNLFIDRDPDSPKPATPLTKGSDYQATDGSTKLDIPAATFQSAGVGSHNITAEFQTQNRTGDDDNGIRTASQVYTVFPEGKVKIDASEIQTAKVVQNTSLSGRFKTIPPMSDEYSRFRVISGDIPNGLTFHENADGKEGSGYFTGTPQQAGEYTFTIGLQVRTDTKDYQPDVYEDTVTVTVKVEPDTATAVEQTSDPGYELVEPLPAVIEESGGTIHLTSEGPFEEFTDFYIDGKKQVRGVDYQVKPCLLDPVTKKMIRLLDAGGVTGTYIAMSASKLDIGTHDLNLEFVKTDPIGNKQTRNASQKVTVKQKTTPVSSGGGGGGGGSSAPTTYAIKAAKASNGKITLSATKIAAGKTVTITVTPNKGYVAQNVSATDSKQKSVALTRNGNKYTFTMPKLTVTVSATFAPSSYTVSVSQAQHGKITLNSSSVSPGAVVNGTATPDNGYLLSAVTVRDASGKSVKVETFNNGKFTFLMPSGNVTVSATFTPSAYNISAASAEHGKVTLDKSTAVNGAIVNGTTTPDKGYLLSAVTVRDTSGNNVKSETFDNGKFTFLMPSGHVTVSATFAVKRLASFVDIQGPDWFFDDAEWAYQKSILRGVTAQYWEPQSRISAVTSVVTLERLDGVNLSEYDTGAEDGLDNNAWYVAAARWAKVKGILPDGLSVDRDALSRGDFALMLANYLRYRGISEAPGDATFTDADTMSPAELDAFRILQKAGVFQGYKDGTIKPRGYLSRAHLSALLHRLSNYIIKAEQERFTGA